MFNIVQLKTLNIDFSLINKIQYVSKSKVKLTKTTKKEVQYGTVSLMRLKFNKF